MIAGKTRGILKKMVVFIVFEWFFFYVYLYVHDFMNPLYAFFSGKFYIFYYHLPVEIR
jgi:hypothetical protein